MSKYIIRATATGYKFHLLAANGQAIASSEVYNTLAACRKSIDSVAKCAPLAPLEDQSLPGFRPAPHPKFELFTDKSGTFRFRLKARNGKIIAVSDGYGTKSGCEKGIESVRVNAHAPVETDALPDTAF